MSHSHSRRLTSIHRIGECHNCGDCCILFIDNTFKRCVWYNLYAEQHCTIYPVRPQVCRDFPRGPADLLDKPNCGYRFVDDYGIVVDGYQDPRTQFRATRVLHKLRIQEVKEQHAKRRKPKKRLPP